MTCLFIYRSVLYFKQDLFHVCLQLRLLDAQLISIAPPVCRFTVVCPSSVTGEAAAWTICPGWTCGSL